ncbi:MAG: YebC/PmpR family DNA-binding transcriptional regulator, partial [Planctomycetota bacterium]
AGHSKWANIKHRKARQDSKRSKMWSKCSRAIIVAAKHGGGDPDQNLTLRYAIDEAKAANMPKDTIAKAVEKGAGGGDGSDYEEIVYEGYAPGGVAVMLEILTDNRNRTASEMRKLFEKGGGNLGASGSVAFNFERKGELYLDHGVADEEAVMEAALEAGAEDIEEVEETDDDDQPVKLWRIVTGVDAYHGVKQAFDAKGWEPVRASLVMIALNTVACSGKDAEKLLKFIDDLEDNDDVQHVHANFDIDDAEYASLAG